uniref:DUF3615 domain-containing protein n=1 Tax=Oryza rufipogon TaxID=4529 RepID=A0A0E0PQR7_ORYRU
MRRPTIEEKLATYSMFQVRQGSTVPITAREWLDSVMAGVGSISLAVRGAGSISAAAGAGDGACSSSVAVAGTGSISAARAGDGPFSSSVAGAGAGSISATAGAGHGAGSSSVAAAGSGEAPARRKRTPGRWRRIPRTLPHPCLRKRPMTWEELLADSLDMSDEVHCFREEDKPAFRKSKAQMARFYQRMIDIENNKIKQIFRPRVPSDTHEQHLTAEEMEAEFAGKKVSSQACHFANLAINHYNNIEENIVKIELCTVLLSNCFHEICGSTYAHVNFTARAEDDDQAKKRLYFAELKLNPDLLAKRRESFVELSLDPNIVGCADDIEPMCVVSIHNLQGSCFGGCHEINRRIDYVMIRNQDYERCHACSDRIKHPYGTEFIAGHDSSKIPYYTAG